MKRLGIVVACLCMAVLAACATPYQPAGIGGGYRESKINDSAYFVSFGGNGYATESRVHYFWLYRCAELTIKNGYDYFLIRPTQSAPPKTTGRIDGQPMPAVYRPGMQAQLLKVHAGGYSAPVMIYGGGGNIQTWTSSGVVLMFKKPLLPSLLFALDAHSVMNQLGEYVRTNGDSKPPATADLISDALVAHVKVEFGNLLRPPTPATGAVAAGTAPAPLPRTDFAILQTLGQFRVPLFAAYQEYQQRTKSSPTIVTVVGFSVSSGGLVSDCHVVSSTLDDSAFTGNIASRIRSIDFGARNVSDSVVMELPIKFTALDTPPVSSSF